MHKLLMILVIGLFVGNILSAEEQTIKSYISVNGKCVKKIMPDKGSVRVTIKVLKKTSTQTSAVLKRIYEKIRQKIKKLKLKNLELLTSNYSVHREDSWEQRKKIFKGYRGTVTLNIYSSDIKGLANVFDVASVYNEAEVDGLSRFISRKKFNEIYEDCLVKAVSNAMIKAKRMAKAAKARLGGVITITEGYKQASPRPIMMRGSYKMASANMEMSQPLAIETKSQEVRATVSMTLNIK